MKPLTFVTIVAAIAVSVRSAALERASSVSPPTPANLSVYLLPTFAAPATTPGLSPCLVANGSVTIGQSDTCAVFSAVPFNGAVPGRRTDVVKRAGNFYNLRSSVGWCTTDGMTDTPFTCTATTAQSSSLFEILPNATTSTTQLRVYSIPTPGGPQIQWSSAQGPPAFAFVYPNIKHPLLFEINVENIVESK